MAGGVFVGRPRPLWKVALYGLITFGVYGRVHLYKSAKEIDGHEVLFLDLRLWLLGAILPIGGPLVLKWRLLHHVAPMVKHDATAPRVHVGWLRAAAFLPWIPLYHVLLQRHLSHHWILHRKLADLEARGDVLEQRRAHARTDADREAVRRLEADLRLRGDVLKQAQEAALEIREAKRARERAEAEIRAAGGQPSALERIKKASSRIRLKRRGPAGDESPEPEATAPVEAPPTPKATSRRPPPEPEPVVAPPPVTSASPDPPDASDPNLSKAERKALERMAAEQEKRQAADAKSYEKRLEKARRRAEKTGEGEPAAEPMTPSEPSRKERKLLSRYEKARAKRERRDAKLAQREASKAQAAEAPAADGAPAKAPRKWSNLLRRGKGEEPPTGEAQEAPPIAPETRPEPPSAGPVEAARPRTRAKRPKK